MNTSSKMSRSNLRFRGFYARYAVAMKARNRIYLALMVVKVLAIIILAVTHDGITCGVDL